MHALTEAIEGAREGSAQQHRHSVEAHREIARVERGRDHSTAPTSAGSVIVGARRRAKPEAGMTRRYGASIVLTTSLMSFCEKVTVSPVPSAFDTSPMRVRSR